MDSYYLNDNNIYKYLADIVRDATNDNKKVIIVPHQHEGIVVMVEEKD